MSCLHRCQYPPFGVYTVYILNIIFVTANYAYQGELYWFGAIPLYYPFKPLIQKCHSFILPF